MKVYIVLQNDDSDVDVLSVCESLEKAIEAGVRKGTFEAEWEVNHFKKTGSLDDGSYKLEIVEKELT